jgi:uncharacterized protein
LSFASRTSVTKTLHQHCSSVFKNYSELYFGNNKIEKVIPTSTCLPFQYKVFLTVSGKILPCEKISHQFALGSVDNDNKVNIDFEQIAQKYNEFYDKMESQCSICRNAMLCGQCIFNMPDIECKKPVCIGFMSESEFTKYLSLQLDYLEKYPKQYSFIMKNIIGS